MDGIIDTNSPDYFEVKVVGTTVDQDGPSVQIPADWMQNDSSKSDYIKNKPNILTKNDIIETIDEQKPENLLVCSDTTKRKEYEIKEVPGEGICLVLTATNPVSGEFYRLSDGDIVRFYVPVINCGGSKDIGLKCHGKAKVAIEFVDDATGASYTRVIESKCATHIKRNMLLKDAYGSEFDIQLWRDLDTYTLNPLALYGIATRATEEEEEVSYTPTETIILEGDNYTVNDDTSSVVGVIARSAGSVIELVEGMAHDKSVIFIIDESSNAIEIEGEHYLPKQIVACVYSSEESKWIITSAGEGPTIERLSIVFDSTEQLDQWIAGEYTREDGIVPEDLYIGESIYIRATGEPDYWWDGGVYHEQEVKIELDGYATLDADNKVVQVANNADKLTNEVEINGLAFDGSHDVMNYCPEVTGAGALQMLWNPDIKEVKDGLILTWQSTTYGSIGRVKLGINEITLPMGAATTNIRTAGESGEAEYLTFGDIVKGGVYQVMWSDKENCWLLFNSSRSLSSVQATKAAYLSNARNISLANGAEGTTSFDGRANVTIDVTSLNSEMLDGSIDVTEDYININKDVNMVSSGDTDYNARIFVNGRESLKIREPEDGSSEYAQYLGGNDFIYSRFYDGSKPEATDYQVAREFALRNGGYGIIESSYYYDSISNEKEQEFMSFFLQNNGYDVITSYKEWEYNYEDNEYIKDSIEFYLSDGTSTLIESSSDYVNNRFYTTYYSGNGHELIKTYNNEENDANKVRFHDAKGNPFMQYDRIEEALIFIDGSVEPAAKTVIKNVAKGEDSNDVATMENLSDLVDLVGPYLDVIASLYDEVEILKTEVEALKGE